MSTEQIVSWVLQIVMAALIALWGRAQKQTDDLITQKTAALRADLDAIVLSQAKVLALELAIRDREIIGFNTRLDRAGEKASDEANRIMVKDAEFEHRLTVLETKSGLRPPRGSG